VARPARAAIALTALLLVTVTIGACDTGDGKELRDPVLPPPTTTTSVPSFSPIDTEPDEGAALPAETVPVETVPAELTLLTPWRDGAPIGVRHTCDGAGISPGLSWTGIPADAAELAIVVVDVDAEDFVHWVLTGIGPSEVSMLEGTLPVGAIEGPNDDGGTGWTGPCPPAGPPHRYRFTLHVLGQQLEGVADLPADELLTLIDEVSVETVSVFGTYGRS
jgi:Raf kinase inhibitor-like YbhB/YbcL family protein